MTPRGWRARVWRAVCAAAFLVFWTGLVLLVLVVQPVASPEWW